MPALLLRPRELPGWWTAFTDRHPAVSTLVAAAGLTLTLLFLAPKIANPSEHGGMIDAFSVVVAYLRGLYDAHLAFLTVGSTTAWPAYLQVVAALVVGEFLMYLSHVVRHKVPPLWLFHAVHHSQKQLNVFTEDRGHIVDRIASAVLMFVPFYMFQVPNLHAVTVIGVYISIHSRFVHANVKTNLGWLGWVVTSPQFHRVHHSMKRAHWNKNYGGVLSIFDYLFGTACPSSTVYPATGITDEQFPDEDKVGVAQLPRNWLKQMVYPFAQLLGRVPPAPAPEIVLTRSASEDRPARTASHPAA